MINIMVGIIVVAAICFSLYTILRPKLKTYVNCWFCNENQWVPYYQRNSFTCKACDQYNGFDEDGDYNKFIPSQRIEAMNSKNPSAIRIQSENLPNENGLCEVCNEMQAVIVERLNKFEAVDKRRYFQEYEIYKLRLNQKYPLCNGCQEYTEQKLQMINEGYLPTSAKKASVFNPFVIKSTSSTSHSPSMISETSSFAETVFSKHRRRSPSVCSRSSSRSASPFFPRNRAPSIFSEPIIPPTFHRTLHSPSSLASGFSYKTAQSQQPSFLRNQPKKTFQPQKLYFSSGKVTVICNILTLLISFLLFISLFESSQISRNVRFLELENFLRVDTVNLLHLCTNYGAFIAAFAAGIFYYGFNESNIPVNFLDLLTSISWPIFSMFCIFDAERNPDFNLIKMILAAYLFILSSMILFIPKKHRKRANNILSTFSVANTSSPIYSSRLTNTNRGHNFSNLSNVSSTYSELPDPVETWVCSAAVEHQTVTRLNDLHI